MRLPGGITSRVNTAAPEIPAALAQDITGIVGLSSLARAHSRLVPGSTQPSAARTAPLGRAAPTGPAPSAATPSGRAVGSPQACSAATSAAGSSNYTSTQLADSYGLSQLLNEGRTGVGQTIAIVEFEQFSSSDISAFESCYGLSNPTRVVTVDATPSGSASGSGEAALDIELAAVSAPSASLVVYEAPNDIDVAALDLYNRIATDDVAQVVSTSWGFCEQDNEPGAPTQENSIFERMALQGQTMIAASGDSGSEDCFGSDGTTQLAVDDPGSQPDVVSVGGTTLIGGATGSQTVWNNCLSQAFGGLPAGPGERGRRRRVLDGVAPVVMAACAREWAPPDDRVVPDLSLDADPHHGVVVYFGGWLDFGGTSAVAPSLAGFLADTNQGCNSHRRPRQPGPVRGGGQRIEFHQRHHGEQRLHGTNQRPVRRLQRVQSGDGPRHARRSRILRSPCRAATAVRRSRASAPTSDAVSGGQRITINGAGLADATAVSFGGAGAGTIESTTATSIVVAPPSPGKDLCVSVTVTNPQGTSVVTPGAAFAFGGPGSCGYRFVGSDGGIFDFGDAPFEGSTGALTLQKPIVGMAATPSGNGYWLVASDGGVFAFGDAPFYGSEGATHLNEPIVGMASTPDGRGYWLVASDGGIFSFGDAPFYGSTGAIHLNQPIVGMAATPGGGGYWLVASDGGIFSFGNAQFYGSTGAIHLNQPIVGMAATPSGGGYWLVASDGGIFSFGNAQFYGSTGAIHLNQPIVGMAATPSGIGYWLVASDGGVFAFGDAPFLGSTGAIHLNRPIVGIADA